MKRLFVVILLAFAALLALSFFAPLPVPYYQDFSVLYFSNKALLNGIHLYDYPAQRMFVQAQTWPDFSFHPYPYPPWYALATLFLALLPIAAAARMWFLLNIAMIAASVWMLTPRWAIPIKLFATLGAVMFIPAFGMLVVGQYSAPVLLGAALFIFSVRKESAFGAALALALMTFKPHIGIFLALAGFGWLFFRREQAFARRALAWTAALAAVLAVVGLLADPAWPRTYLESLGRYRIIPGVQSCGLCASLSVGLVRLATGQPDTGRAVVVSLVLALGLAGFSLWRLRLRLQNPAALLVFSTLFTLLVDPYLLNYDYILLLMPLLLLLWQRKGWGFLAIIYFLPWLTLFTGAAGNLLLSLAAILTLALFLRLPLEPAY